MFCLYTLPLARPTQAKIQMLTAIRSIVKLIPSNEVNLSHLQINSWGAPIGFKTIEWITYNSWFFCATVSPTYLLGKVCHHLFWNLRKVKVQHDFVINCYFYNLSCNKMYIYGNWYWYKNYSSWRRYATMHRYCTHSHSAYL